MTDSSLPIEVSVVMPTYNSAATIGESVRSVLQQLPARGEILIMDDGSTDDTGAALAPFLEDPRVVYRKLDHGGGSRARNQGLGLARGALIAFLDADDVWEPNALKRRMDFLIQHPEVDLVYGNAYLFDHNGRREQTYIRREDLAVPGEKVFEYLLTRRNFIPFGSVLHRREIRGGRIFFDESFPSCQDYEYLLKILSCGRCAMVDGIHLGYRIHGGNLSRNLVNRHRYNIKLLMEYRDRLVDNAAAHRTLQNRLYHLHFELGRAYFQTGQLQEARREYQRSLPGIWKRSPKANFYSLAAFLPSRLIRFLRKLKRNRWSSAPHG